MKKRLVILTVLFATGIAGFWAFASTLTLRALDTPGKFETAMALRAKRWLVQRAASDLRAPAPLPESVNIGGMQFRARCAACHGPDGRTPSDLGLAMYPPAPDLGRAEAQAWADTELFWITKNGIRLSGMPGFGRALSDEEIWPLVQYIRSLRQPEAKQVKSPTGKEARAVAAL